MIHFLNSLFELRIKYTSFQIIINWSFFQSNQLSFQINCPFKLINRHFKLIVRLFKLTVFPNYLSFQNICRFKLIGMVPVKNRRQKFEHMHQNLSSLLLLSTSMARNLSTCTKICPVCCFFLPAWPEIWAHAPKFVQFVASFYQHVRRRVNNTYT